MFFVSSLVPSKYSVNWVRYGTKLSVTSAVSVYNLNDRKSCRCEIVFVVRK